MQQVVSFWSTFLPSIIKILQRVFKLQSGQEVLHWRQWDLSQNQYMLPNTSPRPPSPSMLMTTGYHPISSTGVLGSGELKRHLIRSCSFIYSSTYVPYNIQINIRWLLTLSYIQIRIRWVLLFYNHNFTNTQEFRGRRHRTCWRKSHRSHNQNVVIK